MKRGGGLYAICVAFLLIKEMQDFAELKSSFKKEGFIIKSNLMYLYYIEEDIYDKNSGLSEKRREKRIKVVQNIKDNLRQYLVHLLEYDLIGKDNGTDSEVYIWECVKEVAKIKPLDGNDQIALGRIMSKLEEMFLIRSTRSGWIETGLSPYLLVFISLLSLVIIFPFYTFSSINPMINYVSLGTLVFFLSFLLVTLMDVGNPFSGYWLIPTEMFEDILENEFKESGLEVIGEKNDV